MAGRGAARHRAGRVPEGVALAAALCAAACRDAAVPEPAVDTMYPAFDSLTVVAGDSTAVVEGVVSDDLRLLTVDWYFMRAVTPQGVLSGLDLIRHETIPLAPARRARFRIETPPASPSSNYPFWLEAHDAAGRVTYWSGAVAIGPATPAVRVRALGGDTVRGLAVQLDATVLARRRIVQTELIRGDGAILPSVSIATADSAVPFGGPGHTPRVGTMILPLPVASGGPLRVTLRAIDDSGRVGTGAVTLVHLLPDAPYDVAVLGPAGSADSDARDLNDRGDVVGTVTNAAGTAGVVWRAAAGRAEPVAEPLAAPRDSVADPAAINERGEVAGTLRARSAPNCGRATIWPPAGAPRYAAPTVPPCSMLYDINDRGDAVGLQITDVNPAFVTRGDTLFSIVSLGAPAPRRIGNSGLALGTEAVGLRQSSAVAWLPQRVALPCPTTFPQGRSSCAAVDLDELGQLLGVVDGRPVLWQPGPRLVSLLPKLYGTTAVGLNDRGHVLAYRDADSTAFVLRDSAVVRVRLTDASWSLHRVTAMNAAGQIIGHGIQRGTGRRGALLLTPAR